MLSVVRSGYYAWKISPQSTRDIEDIRLTELIKKSFDESRQTYGCKRIQDDLKDWGAKRAKSLKRRPTQIIMRKSRLTY